MASAQRPAARQADSICGRRQGREQEDDRALRPPQADGARAAGVPGDRAGVRVHAAGGAPATHRASWGATRHGQGPLPLPYVTSSCAHTDLQFLPA